MARRVRFKDPWIEQRSFTRRAVVGMIVATVLLGLVAVRLFYLQVIRYDHYAELSQGNRVRLEPLPPDRGVIFDRKGRVLAENSPAYQLELTREQVPDLDATLARLVALGLIEADDTDRIRRLVRSRRPFEGVPIRAQLTDAEIGRYAVHRHELRGVDLRTRLARFYPYGESAVHALGYVGTLSEDDLKRVDAERYAGLATIGKNGIERHYEDVLHGTVGHREVMVNAEGRSVESLGRGGVPLRRREPIAGRDLYTTLDIDLQRVAEEALAGKRGAIVAIDPWTGDVLALASLPTFDANKFARGISAADYRALIDSIDRPLFNRAIRGVYPPGSTIKPLMALAGLEYGVIEPADSVRCPGYFRLPGSRHRFRDWRKQGHGTVDMNEAVMTSCDVYFYTLATTLGIERMHESMTHLGFGAPTGIDIDGEKGGLVPSPEWKRQAFKRREQQVWFPGETVITGIGQGFWLVTPLQLANAAAVVATRGRHYRPRLVDAVRDPRSGAINKVAPVPLPPIELKNPQNWDAIIESMVAVTSGPRGTAVVASRGARYRIAGKTGTAQVFTVGQSERYNENEVDERLRDHALFIAFAPADDPKLAVAVLVENGGHGSSAAAPVARKLFDAYLADWNPPPSPAPATTTTAPAPATETTR
jgi:penicillin-binding protein 2